MDFGTHRFLTDTQRRVAYRFADEVLYAIGVYLLCSSRRTTQSPAGGRRGARTSHLPA